MAVHPQTIGVTELRRRASEVIEQLQESHEPLIVTAYGKSVAVLLHIEDYQALLSSTTPEEEDEWELADPTPEELEELKRNLAMSEAKIEQGIPWEEAKRYLLARRTQRKR